MGESSFWYRPTRVVPDQRPLNGRRHLLQHSEIASFALHCVTGVCAARVGSSTAARWHVDSRPCDSGMWTAGTVGVGSRVRTLVYWRCH